MSDDTFIREVNEEIRQDQAKALWDSFGPAILGLALLVVVVLGVAVYFLVRFLQRRGGSVLRRGGSGRPAPRPKPSAARRPVAPDDEPVCRRDRDRKTRHRQQDDPDS